MQFIICSPMASKLQIAVNKDVIDIDNFSLQKWSPMASEINREEFLGISFSHHMEILHKTKDLHEILFYIHQTVLHKWDKYVIRDNNHPMGVATYKTAEDMSEEFRKALPDMDEMRKLLINESVPKE